MSSPTTVAAVDLGATSVRVATVALDGEPAEPAVVHRWRHGPVPAADGSLRWDWDGIVAAVRTGLDAATERAPLASIGIDVWGLDYGLLDQRGELLSPPYSYRDPRTAGWEQVVDRIGRQRFYGSTGVQLMAIDTIFQLAVHDREELARASRAMMLPDLLAYQLCGHVGTELTIASTTGLLDVRARDWCPELFEAIGVDPTLFPPIMTPGAQVGRYRGVPVHLVGSHDSASAVAALPVTPGTRTAFVSSGTWSIVGRVTPEPITSAAAFAANCSNELAVDGEVRLLRNVMGMWIVEECRRQWGAPSTAELVQAAAQVQRQLPEADVMDERFLAPTDMEATLRAAAGLPDDATRAEVIRCALGSIATATAEVLRSIAEVSDEPIEEVHVAGGGGRITLLNQAIGERLGARVYPASPEATALGNALVQGVALGRFADLDDARAQRAPT